MARLIGARVHGDRLRRLGGHIVKTNIQKATVAGAQLIADEAKRLIITGAVSGPGHVASAPGDPPNADTHELDQSIHVVANPVLLSAKVVADSDKAAPLEFGTSIIEERPFMKPAGKAKRPLARRLIALAINQANRGH